MMARAVTAAVPLALLRWRSGGWDGLVAGGFGVHELLELAAVQEDAAAVGALLDVDAVAFVAAHRPLALGHVRSLAMGAFLRWVDCVRVDAPATDELLYV